MIRKNIMRWAGHGLVSTTIYTEEVAKGGLRTDHGEHRKTIFNLKRWKYWNVCLTWSEPLMKKELRGSLSVMNGVTRSVGMILTYLLAALLPWYSVSYVGSLAPLAAFVLLLNSPESPVFLLTKGKIDKGSHQSRKNIKWMEISNPGA